jgi:hypothetical protein
VLKAGNRLEFVRLAALIAQRHGFSVPVSRYNAAMTFACDHVVSLLKLLVSYHSAIHWDGRADAQQLQVAVAPTSRNYGNVDNHNRARQFRIPRGKGERRGLNPCWCSKSFADH